MHCFDHHGITAVVAGGVLQKLVREEERLGTSQQFRLDNINTQMHEFQSHQKPSSRMPKLRPSDLMVNDWFELGGVLITAVNTRNCSPFVVHLAGKYFDRVGSGYDEAVVKLAKALDDLYNVIWSAGLFLNADEMATARGALQELGLQHMVCRKFAQDRGEFAFQIRPKAHYAQHFVEQMALINPRHTMCYQEESLIGVVTDIYHKS